MTSPSAIWKPQGRSAVAATEHQFELIVVQPVTAGYCHFSTAIRNLACRDVAGQLNCWDIRFSCAVRLFLEKGGADSQASHRQLGLSSREAHPRPGVYAVEVASVAACLDCWPSVTDRPSPVEGGSPSSFSLTSSMGICTMRWSKRDCWNVCAGFVGFPRPAP